MYYLVRSQWANEAFEKKISHIRALASPLTIPKPQLYVSCVIVGYSFIHFSIILHTLFCRHFSQLIEIIDTTNKKVFSKCAEIIEHLIKKIRSGSYLPLRRQKRGRSHRPQTQSASPAWISRRSLGAKPLEPPPRRLQRKGHRSISALRIVRERHPSGTAHETQVSLASHLSAALEFLPTAL